MALKELSDFEPHIKLKLSLLWVSVLFCYIYCDYFELYAPGKLQSMLDGKMGPLGAVTQSVLIGTSVMMLIPSLMVILTVVLPARASQILNVLVGAAYTALLALLAFATPLHFYKLYALIEAVLTAIAVWWAWHWPRASGNRN